MLRKLKRYAVQLVLTYLLIGLEILSNQVLSFTQQMQNQTPFARYKSSIQMIPLSTHVLISTVILTLYILVGDFHEAEDLIQSASTCQAVGN